ncbi:MAG: type II secretion system protein GspN [bacterium]|nr:type II secretion system protein GspN [bacterium]
MRWLRRFLIALVVFTVVLAVTFPTDTVIRWVLDRVIPPGTQVLTFSHARLRPWGIIFDDLVVRSPEGREVLAATYFRFRPSWLAFLHDPLGRPWHVSAEMCLGEIGGSFDLQNNVRTFDVDWKNVDLATCLPMFGQPLPLSGRTTGETRLVLPVTSPAEGDGELEIRHVTFEPPLPQFEDLPLRADRAGLRWTLKDQRLVVGDVGAEGPDLQLTAQGEMRLAQSFEQSTLRLRVTLTPQPGAPPRLLRLLENLPRGANGTRDFLIVGTLNVPEIARP